MTGHRPKQPPTAWEIRLHCQRCTWADLLFLGKPVDRFRTQQDAVTFIAENPYGPPTPGRPETERKETP